MGGGGAKYKKKKIRAREKKIKWKKFLHAK